MGCQGALKPREERRKKSQKYDIGGRGSHSRDSNVLITAVLLQA